MTKKGRHKTGILGIISNLINSKFANTVGADQNLTNFTAHHKFNQLTSRWKNMEKTVYTPL